MNKTTLLCKENSDIRFWGPKYTSIDFYLVDQKLRKINIQIFVKFWMKVGHSPSKKIFLFASMKAL